MLIVGALLFLLIWPLVKVYTQSKVYIVVDVSCLVMQLYIHMYIHMCKHVIVFLELIAFPSSPFRL